MCYSDNDYRYFDYRVPGLIYIFSYGTRIMLGVLTLLGQDVVKHEIIVFCGLYNNYSYPYMHNY